MRYRSIRYVYVAAVLLIVGNLFSYCVVFLHFHDKTYFYLVNPISYLSKKDVECFKMRNKNTANISKASFFSKHSIFFHSLSCHQIIDERGACAIESAARLHPKYNINLLYTSVVSKKTWSKYLDRLIKLPNFRLVGIQVEGYADRTEFEPFWRSVISHDKLTEAKDILEFVKILTLHRFGGIVLDLDVIVNKQLNMSGHMWLVKDGQRTLGTHAMSIPRSVIGHNVTTNALRSLSKQILRGEINGRTALVNGLLSLCPKYDFSMSQTQTCYGFEIYKDEVFNPISPENWQLYNNPGSYNKKAFAHHVWEAPRPSMVVSRHTLYASLAKAFCPLVYSKSYDYLID